MGKMQPKENMPSSTGVISESIRQLVVALRPGFRVGRPTQVGPALLKVRPLELVLA